MRISLHFLLLLGLASAQLELLDRGLAAVATLVGTGALSAAAEEASVRRMLQGDEALLLLSKHFGALPSYSRLLHDALGVQSVAAQPMAVQSTSTPSGASLLTTRRSVKAYDVTRPVPDAVVRRALDAAVLAPNHFLTEPWRFYWLGPAKRKAVAALNPAKREAFEAVPGWMVVSLAASEYADDGSLSTKKGLEDHAATSCAILQFMLSLTADGVGSKWMTGALGIAPEAMLSLVGANSTAERFMGAIWFGYPQGELSALEAPPRKRGVDGVLKVLD